MQDRLVDKRKFQKISERALSELQETGAIDLCGERAGALVGCCFVICGSSPRHEVEGDGLSCEGYDGGMRDVQIIGFTTKENAEHWTLGEVLYYSKSYFEKHENDHVWAEIWEVVPNHGEYWTVFVVQARDNFTGEWVSWSGMHDSYYDACRDMAKYHKLRGVFFDSLRLMELGASGEIVSCWEVD